MAGITVFVAVILLAVGPGHAQTMKMVVTQIPVPTDDAPQPLEGLKYGHPWIVEFTSIRVEWDPAKSLALWTITGSSGRARPERVQIMVKLLDESGNDLATAKKATIVKTGGKNSDYVLKMKVKQEDWDAASVVKVFVNFFIAA